MIDQDRREVLSELINISFGSATAIIAELFDNFASLRVPRVDVIGLENINSFVMEKFDGNKAHITTQQFKGKFQGETILIVDDKSAQNVLNIVDEDGDIEENEAQQTILEISNILGSSCIGKLAELLTTEVTFSPPAIDYTDKLIKNVEDSPYSQVIVVSTVLEFHELDIKGDLFILISDAMYIWLKQAIDNFLENI